MYIRKTFASKLKERYQFEIFEDGYRISCKETMIEFYGLGSIGAGEILEELIIQYDDFVIELCEIGYIMSSYEFDNDIDSFRGAIDVIINAPKLELHSEHKRAKEIIEFIDNKFINITTEHHELAKRTNWYSRRILLMASEEYYETTGLDFKGYNIQIMT